MLYAITNYTARKIDTIELDVTLRENHSYKSTVAQFPIEDGSVISDHITNQPVTFSLEGFVSDNPISASQDTPTVSNGGGGSTPSRSRTTFNSLLALREERKLVTIISGLKVYTNMAITSIEVNVTPETTNSLRFTAELKEVKIVSSEIILLQILKPIVAKTAQKKVDTGKASLTPAEEEKQKKTFLFKAVETIMDGGINLVGA